MLINICSSVLLFSEFFAHYPHVHRSRIVSRTHYLLAINLLVVDPPVFNYQPCRVEEIFIMERK